MNTNDFIWSIQQAAIFGWVENPQPDRRVLAVIARAGTGKTTTIIEAIRRAPERSIDACAFNKEIAAELRKRLAGSPAQAMTLHSLGNSAVKRRWGYVKTDNLRGVRLARIAVGDDAPESVVSLVAEIVSKTKGVLPHADTLADIAKIMFRFGLLPDREMAKDGWDETRIGDAVLATLRAAKRKGTGGERQGVWGRSSGIACIDFDDMVWLPVVLGLPVGPFDLVVIDEAQDMSPTQIALAEMATAKGGRRIYVGDPMQAIYEWRGADAGVLDRIVADGADVLPLTVTRRCGKSIVALAKTIVPDFEAAPDAHEGEVCEGKIDPAKLVPGDAVVSRKNAPLAPLCLSLLRRGVRARIEGKDIGGGLVRMIERARGRGRNAAQDLDELLRRLRERHARDVEKLLAAAAAKGDRTGASVEDRIGNLTDSVETIAALAEECNTITALIDMLYNLFDNTAESPTPCVTLTSVHKSKGREWNTVYVLADTLRSGGEESRIAYVAYTRAKNRLVLARGVERAAE